MNNQTISPKFIQGVNMNHWSDYFLKNEKVMKNSFLGNTKQYTYIIANFGILIFNNDSSKSVDIIDLEDYKNIKHDISEEDWLRVEQLIFTMLT